MRAALVGMPFAGKSTLFSALTGAEMPMDPSQEQAGMVKVPDPRLDWLNEQYKAKKYTPADLEFVDVPGMSMASPADRDRAVRHFPTLRQSDLLVAVVRGFENASVPAYRNRVDPDSDLQELYGELAFADLDQVTRRIEKLEVSVKKPTQHRDADMKELDLQKKILAALEDEKPVSAVATNAGDLHTLRSFGFLTLKPLVIVLNVSEDQIADPPAVSVPDDSVPVIHLCAKIEQELAQLDEDDRAVFMEDLGLDTPARDALVRACYKSLGLISFLTAGEKEVRAWPIPAGTTAVDAAGKIHSDLARGFIKAETVAYDDLVAAGSEKEAKAQGKVRLEGKEYVVKDGDVIVFRHNT